MEHVQPRSRIRRPNYVRMACVSASVSFREKLTEDELVRALLTSKVPANRRPHFRVLLREAPDGILKGLVEDVGSRVEPGLVDRNLTRIAAKLQIRKEKGV